MRNSTYANYLSIWRHFNKFLIRLDRKPDEWEDRTAMFCGYLIGKGNQSQTVKSYVSAIKTVLKDDGYVWNQNKILIASLTRACKIQNDIIKCRFPIRKGLFELILFELSRVIPNQPYLQSLYRSIFCMGYYGLMRIGELTESNHVLKARNIHVGINKDKIMVVLYSSKTHGAESYPQKIKITATDENSFKVKGNDKDDKMQQRIFCPFQTIRKYMEYRGSYDSDDENFYVFRDKSIVQPQQAREMLKSCIEALRLDPSLYNFHSLRGGRSQDLLLKEGLTISEICRAGRWTSNAVYKYLKE